MASQATLRRFPDINSQSTGLNPTCPIPDANRLRQAKKNHSSILKSKNAIKSQALSEALRRAIANRGLYRAESKDPGDAFRQMLLGAFRPQTTLTNSHRSGPAPACR